jgi:hypothetical protein
MAQEMEKMPFSVCLGLPIEVVEMNSVVVASTYQALVVALQALALQYPPLDDVVHSPCFQTKEEESGREYQTWSPPW